METNILCRGVGCSSKQECACYREHKRFMANGDSIERGWYKTDNKTEVCKCELFKKEVR